MQASFAPATLTKTLHGAFARAKILAGDIDPSLRPIGTLSFAPGLPGACSYVTHTGQQFSLQSDLSTLAHV